MTNARTGLIEAFERTVLEVTHDPSFAGIEIVEQKSRPYGAGFELTLAVERSGAGVDVATCERIAGRLNVALDGFAEPYTLAVQSAGLDRPLLRPADYERFRGEAVRLRTNVLLDGRKTHRGTLTGMRGPAVALDIAGTELSIPFDSIESANVEFDIRADLRRAKKERKDARKSR